MHVVKAIGWLGKSLPAESADIAAKQQVQVDVISPGSYAFTTNTINGVTFSASGIFTSTGLQTVTLIGSGTPVNYTVDNNVFNYTVTNTTEVNAGSCSFGRSTYQPDQNYTGNIRNDGKHRFLYKVITGIGNKEWLQTNLGAHYNQVGHPNFNPEMAATNVDDYLAFGSLFQLGRNSDGHELLAWTSATTASNLSVTSTPAPASTSTPVNTGIFYVSAPFATTPVTGNNYSLAIPLNGRAIMGPGMPCPSGFMVPNETNNDYTTPTDYNAGSAYWLSNSLKLVAPKVYRDASNGNLILYNRRLIRGNSPGKYPFLSNNSPQFVIEGGTLLIPQNNTTHYDRRAVESYNGTDFDVRGSLDGYPVRCVKP